MLAFKHLMIIVVISLDRNVILNNISGVKVRFPICHVYNKVKYKQRLLNSLNYTSLGNLFYLKIEAVFDRHEVTIFLSQRKGISSDEKALWRWVYIFFLRNAVFLSLKTTTHCLHIFLSYMF